MNKLASGVSDALGDSASGPLPRLPKHLPLYFQGPVTPRFNSQVSKALVPRSRFWTWPRALPLWTTSQPHESSSLVQSCSRGGLLTTKTPPALSTLALIRVQNPRQTGVCRAAIPRSFSPPLFFFQRRRHLLARGNDLPRVLARVGDSPQILFFFF